MVDRRAWRVLLVVCVPLFGCSAPIDDANDVGALSAALSACDETVPANRNVDGIPAYAQCDAVADGAIYSNNGVDTSATSIGSDWVKTQYSGGYQCTEFAHRYLYFKWKVEWTPNGNAGTWCDTTPPASSGIVQTTTAVHGDVMVLAPGSCGADASTGHVNVIDVVDAGGRLTAVEQNRAGRNQYMPSCAKCFLHVVANDGAAGASGSGGVTAGAGGAAGTAGRGGAGGVGGSASAGGAGAMPSQPMRPAPQAGAAAPMSPAMRGPLTPAAPAGSGGTNAAAATLPAKAPPASTSNRQPAEGCSVARVGAGAAPTPSAFSLLALLLSAYRIPRRVRGD